ncbi:MAG: MoxR family ATPase [Parcubacteria group bacterium]|nr:MoxR family ATPase [Parcubacteria group bacterium]
MADSRFNDGPRIFAAIKQEIRKVIKGTQMDPTIETIFLSMCMAGDIGHCVFEGGPGTGKTLAVRALGRTISGEVTALSGTDDDRPERYWGYWKTKFGSDEQLFVPGAVLRRPWEILTQRFGPNILTAIRDPKNYADIAKSFPAIVIWDEVTRSNFDTVNSWLEPLQERQATVQGITILLNPAFRLFATRNSFDPRQTIELPRAFMDRIAQEETVTMPDEEGMWEVVHAADLLAYQSRVLALVNPVLSVDEILSIREFVLENIELTSAMERYIAKLLKGTDQNYLVKMLGVTHLEIPDSHETLDLTKDDVMQKDSQHQSGVAPRVAVTFAQLVKAKAFLEGSRFVLPHHVQSVTMRGLQHHIVLSERLHTRRSRVAQAVVQEILKRVVIPEETPHAS